MSSQVDTLSVGQSGGSAPDLGADAPRLQGILSQYQLLSQYQYTYSQLLRTEMEVRLAEADAFGSIVVTEPAVADPKPTSPKTGPNTLLAGLLGMMLAAGVALLMEYMDDRVKSGDKASWLLGVPVLGQLPRLKGAGAKMTFGSGGAEPHSALLEAFRLLGANLQASLPGRPSDSILITRSRARRGEDGDGRQPGPRHGSGGQEGDFGGCGPTRPRPPPALRLGQRPGAQRCASGPSLAGFGCPPSYHDSQSMALAQRPLTAQSIGDSRIPSGEGSPRRAQVPG